MYYKVTVKGRRKSAEYVFYWPRDTFPANDETDLVELASRKMDDLVQIRKEIEDKLGSDFEVVRVEESLRQRP